MDNGNVCRKSSIITKQVHQPTEWSVLWDFLNELVLSFSYKYIYVFACLWIYKLQNASDNAFFAQLIHNAFWALQPTTHTHTAHRTPHTGSAVYQQSIVVGRTSLCPPPAPSDGLCICHLLNLWSAILPICHINTYVHTYNMYMQIKVIYMHVCVYVCVFFILFDNNSISHILLWHQSFQMTSKEATAAASPPSSVQPATTKQAMISAATTNKQCETNNKA